MRITACVRSEGEGTLSIRSFFGFPDKTSLTAASAAPQNIAVASPFAPYPSHLNSVVWPDIVGHSDFLPMTRTEAMAIPAVARARALIATSVAQVPLRAYVGEDEKTVQPRWIDRTDGPMSGFHRMLWTVDDLFFYGWSLWAVTRDNKGVVIAAGRVPWDRWDFDSAGRIEVDGQLVDDDQVILIPGLDEGLLYRGARTVRHAGKLMTAAENAAKTPTPTLELHQTNDAPMTDTEIDALVSSWSAARQGANGGVAYTNSSIELREHGSISDALLIEGRNAAAVDIARACGLPASMLDATGPSASLTYETTEGRTRELIDFGVAPYLTAISSRLSLDDMCPKGTHVAFDVEAYVGPTSTSWTDHATNSGDGGSTPSSSSPDTTKEK